MNTISFPNMFNKNNRLLKTSLSNDIESINESLTTIFHVNKGELLGDPSYGSTIREKIFNLKTNANLIELKEDIVNLVNKFVPRIQTNSSLITIYSNPNDTQYKITIKYIVKPNKDYNYFETIISN